MVRLRNNRKVATLNKENHEEHPRSSQVRDTKIPGSQEDYITQVSGEIEGRVTKKLSKHFSKTESCISGTLSRLDQFHLDPLTQGHSKSNPETSRNTYELNRGTNEDDSQSDPRPKASVFESQTTQNLGPDDA